MPKFSKDIDDIVRTAVKAGWRVEQSHGKHKVLFPPDPNQAQVVMPISISDYRAVKNLKSQLRKSGLQI
jgi:hypothetical protein